MASALLGGLLKRGFPAARILVADPSREGRERLAQDYGVKVTPDNSLAARKADVVILAVKPQQMRALALQLSTSVAKEQSLIISIAAGISHASLLQWFGPKVDVVRCMPNRPALNGFGRDGTLCTSQRRSIATRAGGEHFECRRLHGLGRHGISNEYGNRAVGQRARLFFPVHGGS